MIEAYIKDHKYSWAETTQANELARLNSVRDLIDKGPASLYEAVKDKMKPYSVKTLFIRLSHYMDWVIEEGHGKGPNQYRKFMKKNAKLFKHVYQPKRLEITYDEALERISQIEDEEVADIARTILFTGIRVSEIDKISGDKVCGKGGKTRPFFGSHLRTNFSKSKKTLRRRLSEVGLKPHDLRKLFLTRMSERGATAQDLCALAGWSDIKTAYVYLQPKKTSELKDFVCRNVK